METLKMIFEKITGVSEEANVNMVFGNPQQHGDRTLIPVAEVRYGFGAGYGFGEGDEVEADEERETPFGAGGGGGAGAKVRPLAYIEVGPQGTRIQAIEDEQMTDIAGILLVAWIVGWVGLVLKTLFDDD
jgi:uncharacterized spore protein YtfJ